MDVKRKRMFLANLSVMKVYDMNDVRKVEGAYETDQYRLQSVLREAVQIAWERFAADKAN